jgi:cytoskeleton protein RodZ
MAKRDAEIEAVNEELVDVQPPPVGERLRVAREEKGLSLEDVAAQTRIPQRHLASIETGDWDNLPAPTYTIGFAKNYATAVGLDRVEIGNGLREEMGGQRFASTSSDVFEPADPARTMPKGLVIGAIIAVIILVALMSFLNRRSLDQTDEPAANAAAAVGVPASPAPQAPPPAANLVEPRGQVVLTATAPAWIQVSDEGRNIFQAELQPGQSFTVPTNATAPRLKAGKPEALKVTVGGAPAPQVGPAGKVAVVSLLPADLMKAPQAASPPPAAPPAAPQRPRERARVRAQVPPPGAVPPAETPPITNSQ